MKNKIAMACAVILTCLVSSKAEAKVGDAQWAACVWGSDQEGALNWLKMATPGWQDKFGLPTEMLALRLLAKCDATPADPKKPNRVPNWKSIQQLVKRSQPKVLPVSGPSSIETSLCQYFSVKGSDRALYLAEVMRVERSTSVTVYQTYFDQSGTGAVKVVDYAGRSVSFQFAGAPGQGSVIRMPQATLISSPATGYASEKVCHAILADGSLK
jgi:hypothetical protein